jgi:hypothetical protein
MLSPTRNQDSRDRFGISVAETVEKLRADAQKLYASGDAIVSPTARREAVELRDAMQALQHQEVARTVLKLSFLWHQDVAHLFEDIVQEGCSLMGVLPKVLIRDMAKRAEGFASAIGSPYVVADLLCARFTKDSAPVHVDYGEFLKVEESVLRTPDRRALSLVMPYVGEGTEYLHHSRELVEGELRPYVIKENTSVFGIERIISHHPLAQGCEWHPTSGATYSVHKNGLSIHRAPASKEFRLLLALDACVVGNKIVDPIREVRDRVIKNIRLVGGLRSKLR